MGGEPWHYFVPYRTNTNSALENLREQEFLAGRYRDCRASAEELIEEYGNVQSAIEAIFTESEPDGTASILDMFRVSDDPEPCAVAPLSNDVLRELFGTDKPTRKIVESILIYEKEPEAWEKFWDSIDRGEGRYIVLYKKEQPTEIFFAGYSFD